MSMTGESPRKALLVAYEVGNDALPDYSHRYSARKFTQPQLFVCLVLKVFWKIDYRGLVEALADLPDLCEAIDLKAVPHFTTFQKAAARLLRHPHIRDLLDATVVRALPGSQRVDLAAVDSTGMESHHASRYFVRRRSREPSLWQTTTYRTFPKLPVVCDCWAHVVLSIFTGRGPAPGVHQFRRTLAPATQRTHRGRLLTASGMSAISAVAMQCCQAGDHIVAGDTLYGGTFALLHDSLPAKTGVRTSFVSVTDHATIEAAFTERTKLLCVEAV